MSNSKNKVLLSIIAVLLISNAVLLFLMFGKKGPGSSRERGGMMTEFLTKEVGFSKEQVTRFEEMKKKHREEMKPMFDDLRSAKDSFYILLGKEVPDSVRQQALMNIGDKQEALDKKVFDNFTEVRTICTADQLPKYDTAIQKVIRRMTGGFRRPAKDSTDKDVKK